MTFNKPHTQHINIVTGQRKITYLAGDLDGPDVGRARLRFRNSHSENPIVHRGLQLLEPRIVRDLEPAHKLAALDAHLEHSVILELHQHVLIHEPRKRSLQHVGSRGLPPVEPGVHRGPKWGARKERGECGRERDIAKWVPKVVLSEALEDVPQASGGCRVGHSALSLIVRDDRHLCQITHRFESWVWSFSVCFPEKQRK
jgi:hypothetical protein